MCRSFDSVWLGGGDPRVAACAERMPVPARVDPDGPFIAERGGRSLLEGAGAVIDVGQTSVKIWSSEHGRRRIERAGRSFGELLAAALEDLEPAALVLAVPCEIGDDALGACTYFDQLEFGELQRLVPCPTLVASDAELAAASVKQDVPLLKGPTLVLTLGYGVGAALLLP